MTFEVIGIPQALARPRLGGNHVYQPKSSWQQMVALVAALQRDRKSFGMRKGEAFAGPVALDLEFRMDRPKSLPKRVIMHTKKPDLDNIIKATVDGLVPALLADDRGIVALTARKRYAAQGEAPGARIMIMPFDELGQLQAECFEKKLEEARK